VRVHLAQPRKRPAQVLALGLVVGEHPMLLPCLVVGRPSGHKLAGCLGEEPRGGVDLLLVTLRVVTRLIQRVLRELVVVDDDSLHRVCAAVQA